MSNIKRWTLCAFLFLVCLYIIKILNVKSEGYRGGCGCGCGRGLGLGLGGYGRGLGLGLGGYY